MTPELLRAEDELRRAKAFRSAVAFGMSNNPELLDLANTNVEAQKKEVDRIREELRNV